MPTQDTLQFLKNLEENNSREWFQAHRKEYEIEKAEFEKFCQQILGGLAQIQEDLLNTKVKDCIFRINRDIRFSKDKSPYKKYFSAAFGPGGRSSGRIDFYLQIQPDNQSILGGGMWEPSPAQLATFRQEIDYNPEHLKSIIDDQKFRSYFDNISGEKVKNMPKGYSADHPNIELLKYKQLFFYHKYSDKDVIEKDFAFEVIKGCAILKPYLDYQNDLFYDNA
ncbi:DUF2461 domain-containing protein [Emticicia sp. BO119]|uniref:DUF2461 domain-containing protein n=1 Tax=Emticicia sp. BO119 TaxID=2757768 RepID=UPI0015F10113|nr:DUF2461 domain-containing protein [Emticicia sp. BO119]MBA4853545.1 DUF2461 domain-containing protein [Emticicia sp. BO119]